MDTLYLPTNLSIEVDGGPQAPSIPAEHRLIDATQFVLYGCLFIVCWTGYNLFIYPRFVSPPRFLPRAPGGYPILGHGLTRFKQPLGQDYLQFMKDVPNQGIILFRDLFNADHLLLTSTTAIEEVLSKKPYIFEKPREFREFTSRILGEGLITAEGDVHKRQRRNVTPNYTLRNTRQLMSLYWSRSREMVRVVTREIQSQSGSSTGQPDGFGLVDLNIWASRTTLDIIGTTGLGRKLKAISSPRVALHDAYMAAFTGTWRKGFLYAALWCGLSWLIDLIPWKVDSEFNAATDYLQQFCRESIEKSKQAKLATGDSSPDLLSKLIESNKFTDDELVEHLLTFMTAGHGTTAAAFGWAVYLLARHPIIQSDLRAELMSQAFTDDWITSDPTRLDKVPLLNAVCNETLRLYPSVPLIPRVANQDTSILNCFVPKGTQVMIAPCAVNRASHLWGPTAEQFRPKRWIDQSTGDVNKKGGAESAYAMLTFLHGPRKCLGSEYARAKLNVMVAAWVTSFEFELPNPHDSVLPRGRLAARPGDGNDQLMIRVKPVGG